VVRVFVALGSNLDDPVAQVESGVRALARVPDSRVIRCSSLYRTAPVGVTGQPDFINAVCELDSSLSPAGLMDALLEIEREHGRIREQPGGPRTLDLDLLLYGGATMHMPTLDVPHPRMHERAFVLYPLHEIAPELVIPGRGPVLALLEGCRGQAIERLAQRAG
jgi:2-amino-4-hydroxy-6-hydroxymethyldihydropteridine diphosphokinase